MAPPTPTAKTPATGRSPGVQVVWLKRDLRLGDHEPLAEAAARGPVVVLHVWEPSVWATEELQRCHFRFVDESLRELQEELVGCGGRLTCRIGEMPAVLAELHRDLAPVGGIAGLWSHEETGLRITFDRDLAVGAWCRQHGIPWQECR